MKTFIKYISAAALVAFSSLGLFGQPALAQIAPGVTQSAAHTATISGTVAQRDGTPVPGANVSLTGPAILSTRADDRGVFNFTSVPWGVYQIIVTSGLGTATRNNVTVNGDINVAIQYQTTTASLRTIAHVSTSSAGASINVTPASITSISPSDYAFQGNTSWTQLLNRTPGVVVNGDVEGGEQINDTVPGSLIYAQVISINGALPYETSVMLDGMPLVSQTTAAFPGTGYDLASLPLSIFPQADIVRGPGADAPSIVDSIGGSFVLHPPGRVDQNQVNFAISNDPYGGIVSNLRIAQRFGNLSVTATYGINDSPGPYGNAYLINALSGYELPTTLNGQPFDGCAVHGFCGTTLPCNTVPGEGHVVYGYYNNCGYTAYFLYGNNPYSTEWSQHSGAVSLAYNLAQGVTAQIFYSGTSGQMPDPFIGADTDFVPESGYSGGLQPGIHDFVAQDPYNLYQGSSILEEKLTAYVGRGLLQLAAVQNYSWSFSNNQYAGQYPTPYNYTLFGDVCTGTAAPSATCPTGGTETIFNGQTGTLTFNPFWLKEDFWTRNRDLLASYNTQVGSSFSVGGSYTQTYYNNPDWIGGYYFGPYIAQVIDSANSSTLGEVRLNASGQISDKFAANASWYFAQQSYHIQEGPNIGDAAEPWTDSSMSYNGPRLGLTWRANQNVAIRAAAGGGFAVPPIGDLLGQNVEPTSCFSGVCTETLNNYNLRPETSFGIDVGTDIRLKSDSTLSFDLYNTDLFGQFFLTTTTGSYSGPGCGTPPCELGISQYNNLQESRYQGMNVTIQAQPPHGFYWQASLGLTRGYIVSLPPNFYNDASCPHTACNNVYILPNENFNGATQAGLAPEPYANGSAIIGYRWQPREYVDLWPTYYGNGNAYFQKAFMEFDAHLSYPIGRSPVAILLTGRNITGIHDQTFEYLGPPQIAAPTVTGTNPYPLYAIPYGPRTLIVTLQYNGL